ncbi:unnamed protein product [Phaeothamnion confervicola]
MLTGDKWYSQQAFRALNQAFGRAIRHKDDYAAIVLADPRFEESYVVDNLSRWARGHVMRCGTVEMSMQPLQLFYWRHRSAGTAAVAGDESAGAGSAAAGVVMQQQLRTFPPLVRPLSMAGRTPQPTGGGSGFGGGGSGGSDNLTTTTARDGKPASRQLTISQAFKGAGVAKPPPSTPERPQWAPSEGERPQWASSEGERPPNTAPVQQARPSWTHGAGAVAENYGGGGGADGKDIEAPMAVAKARNLPADPYHSGGLPRSPLRPQVVWQQSVGAADQTPERRAPAPVCRERVGGTTGAVERSPESQPLSQEPTLSAVRAVVVSCQQGHELVTVIRDGGAGSDTTGGDSGCGGGSSGLLAADLAVDCAVADSPFFATLRGLCATAGADGGEQLQAAARQLAGAAPARSAAAARVALLDLPGGSRRMSESGDGPAGFCGVQLRGAAAPAVFGPAGLDVDGRAKPVVEVWSGQDGVVYQPLVCLACAAAGTGAASASGAAGIVAAAAAVVVGARILAACAERSSLAGRIWVFRDAVCISAAAPATAVAMVAAAEVRAAETAKSALGLSPAATASVDVRDGTGMPPAPAPMPAARSGRIFGCSGTRGMSSAAGSLDAAARGMASGCGGGGGGAGGAGVAGNGGGLSHLGLVAKRARLTSD